MLTKAKSFFKKSKKTTSATPAPPLMSVSLFKPAQLAAAGFQRTPEIQQLVDHAFAKLSALTPKECGYVFTGSNNYTFVYHERISTCTSSVIQAKIINHDHAPLSVLDIGAGNFQLSNAMKELYGEKIKIYGITAADVFRSENMRIADEYHVSNNAENLSHIFDQQSFDLIVSRTTFMHFVDKIGSLIEAYKKLKPGGTLLIDQLNIPGCEGYMQHIVIWLQKKGYPVIASCHANEIRPFILQKPLDEKLQELIFPVLYQSHTEIEVKYKPHPDILLLSQSDPYHQSIIHLSPNLGQDYARAVTSLLTQAAEIDATLLNKYDDLPALFDDFTYLSMSLSHQYLFILAVNAKTTSLDQSLATINKLKADSNIHHWGGPYLYLLAYEFIYGNLKGISPELQLLYIKAAATMEIFKQIDFHITLNGFKQLHLPVEIKPNPLTAEFSNCLEFPQVAEYFSYQTPSYSSS